MLVSYKTILDMAVKGNYAIPAFNVYNTETIMGVLQAAEESKSPVIMQVFYRLINEEVGYFIAPSILAAAQKASVPVCFHLDHGQSERDVTRSLRYGATGIMLDGSLKPIEENIALTRRIVEICSYAGVQVEGELGHVGSVNDDSMNEFTEPDAAKEFVDATGVASLAVLVGNAHGRYKKPPKLDVERVAAISHTANIPLVLHGGSGIPDEEIVKAIHAGIRKINFATDVCYAFLDAVDAEYNSPDRSIAIDNFMKKPIKAIKEFAIDKMKLVGSWGAIK